MRPPLKVRVLSTTFTVATAKGIEEEQSIGGDWGKTLLGAQRIILGTGQAPETLRDTVFHEVIHACFFNTGLASDDEFKAREEAIVRALTPILLDVLRRNPKLVTYLISDE